MERIHNSKHESAAHNLEVHHLNKYVVISFLITILMFSVACSLFHSEKDESEFQQEIISMLATEDVSEPVTTEPSGSSVQEPAQQSGLPQDSETTTGILGTHEYSVTAENYTCTCQVSGNATQELRVVDDRLEVVEADGSVNTYEKVGDNTYKRSWMSYYILVVDGEDTKVDREESRVINIHDSGYTLDSYQGTDASPCCTFTFTQVDQILIKTFDIQA